MNQTLAGILIAAGWVIGAPLAGGLVAGIDRILSARMQGRVGPPLLQPFYDVVKLLKKERLIISRYQNLFLSCFLIFTIFTGVLFILGGDFLIILFAFTLADIFFVMSGFVSNSPWSHVGSERELLQMMAHEPIIILLAIGMYLVTGSFGIRDIAAFGTPLLFFLPGVFVSFVFILLVKFRKSPFDLALSHHAHQEIVRGITSDFSGRPLAIVEIAHWYETALLYGILFLFCASLPLIGAGILALVLVLSILVDNATARVKWKTMLLLSWTVTIAGGVLNIVILPYVKG
ncbi:MAG TPA: NADH-quinone oxidoreductase subunit H [Spirochaetia bacterium]|nr:NADH-quinone oxidoreductase subunit H [Spirochaetia bacterium]